MYVQGGQGCAHNLTLCAEVLEEVPQLFTSRGFPAEVKGYNILSDDEMEGTLFTTSNKIYIPYCTMDLYLLDTASEFSSLQFRGRPLLE